MGLETGTYVSDLVTTNPISTDPRSQGDDHLRLIKAVLQASFPNSSRPFRGDRYTAKTAAYTVADTDQNNTLACATAGGAFLVSLPTTFTTSQDGFKVRIVKSDSHANALTVGPTAGTINGETTLTLANIYDAVICEWTGTAWIATQIPYSVKVRAITADATLTEVDLESVLLVTPGASNATLTLPAVANYKGRTLYVKLLSAAFDCILDGSGAETIDGATTYTLATQYDVAVLVCDGSTWHLLDRPPSTASTTEVLTGTDIVKAVTPDALAALWEKGSNTASAATTAFGEGGYLHVTGTTSITDIDFSTAKDGRGIIVQFDGILTLTHHATTLVLPGDVNITTAAGDTACFIQDSGDNIKCLWYCKAQAAVYGGWVPDVILEDQKASGTDGGTFTSGADRVRTLNTEVRDIHAICSLAANQFTLPAGTYYIEWVAPANSAGSTQSFLYNATDVSEVKRGTSMATPASTTGNFYSSGGAVVTIAASKAFEIRHRCSATKTTDGFGQATSFGTEIYTVVKISKIAV